MSARDLTALSLIVVGAVALTVVGFGYEGWRGGVAVFGVLAFIAGVLLGLGDEPAARAPELEDVES